MNDSGKSLWERTKELTKDGVGRLGRKGEVFQMEEEIKTDTILDCIEDEEDRWKKIKSNFIDVRGSNRPNFIKEVDV